MYNRARVQIAAISAFLLCVCVFAVYKNVHFFWLESEVVIKIAAGWKSVFKIKFVAFGCMISS